MSQETIVNARTAPAFITMMEVSARAFISRRFDRYAPNGSPEVPRWHLDAFRRVDATVADVDIARGRAVLFPSVRGAAVFGLVAACVGHREGFVVVLPHAAQQGGQVCQVFGDDVDHLALALQFASAGDHAGGQHQPPLGLEHRGPQDQVGVAGFVLDGDEQHAARAAGALAHQDDARDLDPLAVADGFQVGATDDAACGEVGAQETDRVAAQRQAGAAVVLHDLPAGGHWGQGHFWFRVGFGLDGVEQRQPGVGQAPNGPQRCSAVQAQGLESVGLRQAFQGGDGDRDRVRIGRGTAAVLAVMAGCVPAIFARTVEARMAGTRPAMTGG